MARLKIEHWPESFLAPYEGWQIIHRGEDMLIFADPALHLKVKSVVAMGQEKTVREPGDKLELTDLRVMQILLIMGNEGEDDD